MSDKYIDQNGLARILTNLKANFATKTELQNSGGGGSVSYMSDQEVIAILNGANGIWSRGDRLTILWQNASPSSRFTAQTITLSDSPTNYDFLFIIYNLANTTTVNQNAKVALPFPTSLSTGSLIHIGGSNHGGYRTFSVSGSTITFGSGDFNALTSASKDDYLIPEYVIGVDLDKIGNVKETLATLWTNPSPTASFAAQDVTLSGSVSNFDIVMIDFIAGNNNSTNSATHMTVSVLPGSSGGQALITFGDNNAGNRKFTINGNSISFARAEVNNLALATANTYLIPQKIVGINL